MLDGAFWDGARFGMPRRGGRLRGAPPYRSRMYVHPPQHPGGARPLYGLVGVTSVCTCTFSLLGEKGERGVFSRPLKAPPCPLLASSPDSSPLSTSTAPASRPPAPARPRRRPAHAHASPLLTWSATPREVQGARGGRAATRWSPRAAATAARRGAGRGRAAACRWSPSRGPKEKSRQ